MSFQAYMEAVRQKTGKTPEQLKDEASALGTHGLLMKAKGWVQAPK